MDTEGSIRESWWHVHTDSCTPKALLAVGPGHHDSPVSEPMGCLLLVSIPIPQKQEPEFLGRNAYRTRIGNIQDELGLCNAGREENAGRTTLKSASKGTGAS